MENKMSDFLYSKLRHYINRSEVKDHHKNEILNNDKIYEIIKHCGSCKQRLLVSAIENDQEDLVKALLDLGCDANAEYCDKLKTRPLHYAQTRDVAQLLIDHGADINAKDHAGSTPLGEAYFNGCIGVAEVLLEEGADFTYAKEECQIKPETTREEFLEIVEEIWQKM